MTNNLKTLKDLGWEDGEVEKEEVKAEAIKWVKEKGELDYNMRPFIDFFNLTEEDLK